MCVLSPIIGLIIVLGFVLWLVFLTNPINIRKFEYIISEEVSYLGRRYYIKKRYSNNKEKYVFVQGLFPGLEMYPDKLCFDSYSDAKRWIKNKKDESNV